MPKIMLAQSTKAYPAHPSPSLPHLSLLANTKINLIRTFTYRCYQIYSSSSLLQSALDDIRKRLLPKWLPPRNNQLPHIHDVLERNRNKRDGPVPMVPNKDVIILLPYLGLPPATKFLSA